MTENGSEHYSITVKHVQKEIYGAFILTHPVDIYAHCLYYFAPEFCQSAARSAGASLRLPSVFISPSGFRHRRSSAWRRRHDMPQTDVIVTTWSSSWQPWRHGRHGSCCGCWRRRRVCTAARAIEMGRGGGGVGSRRQTIKAGVGTATSGDVLTIGHRAS